MTSLASEISIKQAVTVDPNESKNMKLKRLKMVTCTLTLTTLLAGLLFCVDSTFGQELDPKQKNWVAYYSKQANAPKPGEMLLNTDAEPDLSQGFTSLFNGEDLSGWNPKGGDCTFEVKDGHIVGTCVPGSNSTYLCTEKSDYKDFLFTCDLKLEVDGNTGVQFRSQSKPNEKPKSNAEVVFGPQVEIEGQGKNGRHWSGGIYGQSCGGYFYPLWLKEHRQARTAEDPTGWNRVTIRAKGNVVKTWLNGVPVAHWVGDGTYAEGFFALQVHKGKAGTILFKNIRVKELTE